MASAAPPPAAAGAARVPASLAELSYRAALAARSTQPLIVGAPTGLDVATAYPATYLINSYAEFYAWARGSLDIVRPQLLALAYPLLLLTALELLLGDDGAPMHAREADAVRSDAPVRDAMSAARHLLDSHRAEFGGAQARELAALALVTSQRQLFGDAAAAPSDDSASADIAASSLLQLGAPAAGAVEPSARARRAAKLAALLPPPPPPQPAGAAAADKVAAAAAALQLGDPAAEAAASRRGGSGLVDGQLVARLLDPAASRYRVLLSPLALQLALEYLTRSHAVAQLALMNQRLAIIVTSAGGATASAAGAVLEEGGGAPPPPSAPSDVPYPGTDALAGLLRSVDALTGPTASMHLTQGSAGVTNREAALTHALRWGVLPSFAHPGSAPPAAHKALPPHYPLLGGRTKVVPWPDYITSPLGRALVCAAGESEAAADAARTAVAAALRVPDARARARPSEEAPPHPQQQQQQQAGDKRVRESDGLAGMGGAHAPVEPPAHAVVQLTAQLINSSLPPSASSSTATGPGGGTALGLLLHSGVGGGGAVSAAAAQQQQQQSAAALRAESVAPVTACAVHEFPLSLAGLAAHAPATSSAPTGSLAAAGGEEAGASAATAAAPLQPWLALPPAGTVISDDPDGLVRVTAAGLADGRLRVFATVRLAVSCDAPRPPAPGASLGAGASASSSSASAAASAAAASSSAPPQPPPALAPSYRTVELPLVFTSLPQSGRASRCVHSVAISPACGRFVLTGCMDGSARLFSIGPQVRSCVRAAVARMRANGVPLLPPPAHQPAQGRDRMVGGGGLAAGGAGAGAGATASDDAAPPGAAAAVCASLLESLASESLHPLATYACPTGSGLPLWAVAFNPLTAGVFATGGRDGCARVWSTAFAGQPAITCAGHVSDVTALAWHPNGLYLFSGAADGAIRLHEAASGDCVRLLLRGHGAPVTALAPAPCGRWAASGDEDGVLTVWDVAPGIVVARGHATASSAPSASHPAPASSTGSTPGELAGGGLAPAPVYALAWEPRTSAVLAAGDAAGCVAVWALAGVVDRYEARTEGGLLNPAFGRALQQQQHEVLRTGGAALASRAGGGKAAPPAYLGAGRLPRGGAVHALAVTALAGPVAAPCGVAVTVVGPVPLTAAGAF